MKTLRISVLGSTLGAALVFLAGIFLDAACRSSTAQTAAAAQPETAKRMVESIRWGFENGSPLQWETAGDGTLRVHLLCQEPDQPQFIRRR